MDDRTDKRRWPITMLAAVAMLLSEGCASDEGRIPSADLEAAARDAATYSLERVFEVEGRQGIATDGKRYYVSGSTSLFVYSRDGTLVSRNDDPFAELPKPANHIGDIDVHDGQVFAGVEWFSDGRCRDIQIAVYSADTLGYLRSIDWLPASGQTEVSAVTVAPAGDVIWLTDWVNGEFVYRYDLETGRFAGKVQLRPVPSRQQGIGWSRDQLFITADDGDADTGEADTLWRFEPADSGGSVFVSLEKKFEELRRAGEIEGITFDDDRGEMAVLSNRGARIVRGMPTGLYPGYDEEIHEVYVFGVTPRR